LVTVGVQWNVAADDAEGVVAVARAAQQRMRGAADVAAVARRRGRMAGDRKAVGGGVAGVAARGAQLQGCEAAGT
jgi:hypothetical protein